MKRRDEEMGPEAPVTGRATPAAGVRLLAGYKVVVGVLLFVVAAELVRLFDQDLTSLVHAWILRLHADPHNPVIAAVVRKATALDLRTLEEFALVTVFFGALHLVEGIGLWLSRAWAEHLCVASTSALLPLEVHEVVAEAHLLKVLTLLVNVAVVVFLVRRLRGRRAGAPSRRQLEPPSGDPGVTGA